MKYAHYTAVNGDGIAKTLLKLREQLGDRWTDSMALYAIDKARRLPSISWREPVPNGVPYIAPPFQFSHSFELLLQINLNYFVETP